MKDKLFAVYIMANERPTLYTGVTNNLIRRVYEHKDGVHKGFTKKYCVKLLVYYEYTNDVDIAIKREKQMKAWKRQWKIRLVDHFNPEWRDLSDDISN